MLQYNIACLTCLAHFSLRPPTNIPLKQFFCMIEINMCFNQFQIYDNIAEKGGVGGLNVWDATFV